MAESKAFQRFNSRFEYLQRHSQVMDISLSKAFNLLKKEKDNGKTLCDSLRVSPSKYNKLTEPSSEYARIINYSKKECADFCFVELYNMFASYMKDILKEMYILRPKSITSKSHKTVTFNKLSEFNSIDEIVNYMIDEIFRDFEKERCTPKLVKRIIGHAGISIPTNLTNNAMMYLEMRHLIIHNNSIIDKEFFDKYSGKLSITRNGRVPTDYENFQAALNSLYQYIAYIDRELIAKSMINPRGGR